MSTTAEVPCLYLPRETCLHRGCQLAARRLRDRVAQRLRLNARIEYDILNNWGRLLRASRKGGPRRAALAVIVRSIRAAGDLQADHYRATIYADALVTDR